MKRITFIAAVFAIAAGAAQAQSATDQLVAGFQAGGFTRIEVKNGPTQTKIEAMRGTEQVEVVIDRATGGVLKREVATVEAGEDTAPGVFIDDRTKDFVDGRTGGDDDDDHGARGGDDDGGDHGGDSGHGGGGGHGSGG